MSHYLITQRAAEAQGLLGKARAARAMDGAEAIQLAHQAASHALGPIEAEAGVVARTQGRSLTFRWQTLEAKGNAPATPAHLRGILSRLDDLAERTHPHTPGSRAPTSGDVAGALALAERIAEVARSAIAIAPAARLPEVEASPMW